MVKKKKAKRFRAVTAVKELARERVGAPPAGQIVVEKKKKPVKHKPTSDRNGQEEKSEALSSCNRGQGISPRARRRAPCGTDRGREKEEAGEAQTYLGQAAGGRMRSTDLLAVG